jgi:pimeloyl-ACP methyl ester carboxylesterase
MIEEPAYFHSEGLKLDASFYLPETDQQDSGRPLLLICSGFMGLKRIHPERFARALTQQGYACFGFDYRGFAKSEGERRRVLLEEQISDIANGAARAAGHPAAHGLPLVLMGWGMGAGLILEAARLIPRIAAMVCINGFYNGRRVQKLVRGHDRWIQFLDWMKRQRNESVQSGVVKDVDPFRIYPVDAEAQGYVKTVLRQNPDFGGKVKPMLADSLLRFAPEHNLDDLSRVPILIVHGERNRMHPPSEAESLYRNYPGPKELVWLWNAGHTEWMDDEHPTFQQLTQRIDEWLQRSAGVFPR